MCFSPKLFNQIKEDYYDLVVVVEEERKIHLLLKPILPLSSLADHKNAIVSQITKLVFGINDR